MDNNQEVTLTILPDPSDMWEQFIKAANEEMQALPSTHGWDEANEAAYELFRVVQMAETQRRVCRSVQAYAAVVVEHHSLWLAFPPIPNYPDGFGSLREFLEAAGLGRRAIYELRLLAEQVAPYCHAHKIDLGPCMAPRTYPKLADALPHLGRLIRNPDTAPSEVSSVLDTVQRSLNRDSVRAKYQQPSTRAVGTAGVNLLHDGRAVMTILFDDERDVPDVNAKLRGLVRWELIVAAKKLPHGASILIEDSNLRSSSDGE
jgi:hypothetical protein